MPDAAFTVTRWLRAFRVGSGLDGKSLSTYMVGCEYFDDGFYPTMAFEVLR